MTTIQPTRRIDTKGRLVRTTFRIPGTEHVDGNREGWFALVVSTSHNSAGKVYRSRVSRVTEFSDGGTRHLFTFSEPEPPLPHRDTATARYSAKTLEQLHDEYERTATDPDTFTALTDWAADQKAL